MMVDVTSAKATKQAPGAKSAFFQQLAAFFETLLLSVWIGSMVFFSFAVAPSAFAVFPDQRELAGRVVTSTIGKVETLGLVIGSLLVLMSIATWRIKQSSRTANALRLALLLVMIAAAALSKFWVSVKLVGLRASMGVIDAVAATDPRRVEFNSLHQYSVALMSVALLAGLVVLFLTVRSWLKR